MTIYVVSTTPPALGIARNGTNWQFSWPGSTHTGWVLETKTNLTDPTWTEFSTSRTSPGTFFVPISPTAHTGFFRLRYP